ncbi:MAG TPA: response regulator [Thermoanaerobaculia bacterium]|nr:response regulator [Thermoanaerobaculia bacterium]
MSDPEPPVSVRRHALIVDNDEGTGSLLRTILLRMGCDAEVSKNGRDAISHLAAADYDLILLDLLMPEVSGQDILLHIRESAPEKLQRVIVVTAVAERANAIPETARPFCVVRKPFDVEHLVTQIRQCIEH